MEKIGNLRGTLTIMHKLSGMALMMQAASSTPLHTREIVCSLTLSGSVKARPERKVIYTDVYAFMNTHKIYHIVN